MPPCFREHLRHDVFKPEVGIRPIRAGTGEALLHQGEAKLSILEIVEVHLPKHRRELDVVRNSQVELLIGQNLERGSLLIRRVTQRQQFRHQPRELLILRRVQSAQSPTDKINPKRAKNLDHFLIG